MAYGAACIDLPQAGTSVKEIDLSQAVNDNTRSGMCQYGYRKQANREGSEKHSMTYRESLHDLAAQHCDALPFLALYFVLSVSVAIFSRKKPKKKYHCQATDGVERDVVDRTGARGFEALVKFIGCGDKKDKHDRQPETAGFYKIYRGDGKGTDGKEGEDRIFGKVRGFSDEGVIGGDGGLRSVWKEEFENRADDAGRFGHGGAAERKAQHDRYPQKKRRVSNKPGAPLCRAKIFGPHYRGGIN